MAMNIVFCFLVRCPRLAEGGYGAMITSSATLSTLPSTPFQLWNASSMVRAVLADERLQSLDHILGALALAFVCMATSKTGKL